MGTYVTVEENRKYLCPTFNEPHEPTLTAVEGCAVVTIVIIIRDVNANNVCLFLLLLVPYPSSVRAVSQQTCVDVSAGQQTEPDEQQRAQQERSRHPVARDYRGRLEELGEGHVPARRSRGNVRDQPGSTGVRHHPVLAMRPGPGRTDGSPTAQGEIHVYR